MLALLWLAGSGPAVAAALKLPNVRWNVAYQNRPVSEVLVEVLTPSGHAIQVSPQVAGTVNGRLQGPISKVFETLVGTFGLSWYFERGVLYIYAASEVRSQMIRLERAQLDAVQRSLDELGLRDNRFELSFDARNKTLLVSGPPRWVDTVTAVAMAADDTSRSSSEAELRVFALRHARAADRTTGAPPNETHIPGVVTLLQQLYGSAPSSGFGRTGTGNAAKPARETAASLYKQFLSTTGRMPRPDGNAAPRGQADSDGTQATPLVALAEARADTPVLPQIHADPRTNSVVIRDYRDRMGQHEAVIRQLDMPTRMVEIEAAILEITSDTLESLGIDWRLSTRKLDIQVGGGTGATLRRTDDIEVQASANVTVPRGAVATMAAGNLVNQLLARVTALEQDGRGRVLSKPKIVTPENMEALIEATATYYVKLQGNLEVSLANVTTGTTLKVFPTIQGEPNAPRVKLALRIEDGSLSSSTVDSLPVVQRNTVTTEAVVAVGQTLLVGGLSVEKESDGVSGVPVLKNLPMVGRAFRTDTTRSERFERIFLLTPRIVEAAP